MRRLKIVVGGAFDAGKTQFVTTASERPPILTEQKVTDETRAIKPYTTAALDFGRATLRGHLALHIFGTPGQHRFDFMWSGLARGMRGLVIMVDSSRPASFREARAILEFFRPYRAPTIVAANKQDVPGARSAQALRRALRLRPEIPIRPCVATDRESVLAVLDALLDMLPPAELEDVAEESAGPPEPVRPRAPAPLAAVSIRGCAGKHHLTRGDARTLCGRPLGVESLPLIVFGQGDCQSCARRARALRLTCADCGRPLTRSRDGRLCLGCAQRRADAGRYAELATLDLALP